MYREGLTQVHAGGHAREDGLVHAGLIHPSEHRRREGADQVAHDIGKEVARWSASTAA